MANKASIEWKYTARERSTGIVKEDKILAPSREIVEDALIQRGYVPFAIEESKGTGFNREISFGGGKGGRVKLIDLAVWARQFSIMINAGLPIIKALNVLAEQTDKPKLRDITRDVKDSVEGGVSLADALDEHPEFPKLIVNMIEAGEAGGFLDETLMRVSKDLDGEVRLKAKIKSAMTYPIVVLFMAISLTAAMLIFIVPVFTGMFEEMGGDLPLPTKILVWMSDFLKVGGLPTIVAIVLFALWWRKNNTKPWIRDFMDPAKLKMPVFGKLNSKIALARFARNLSTLIKSGVPLIKSLQIVGGTIGNVVLARALEDVRHSVSVGEGISDPLSEHEVFPPMVVQMIAVGEGAGNIDHMLEKIADDYEQQVETTTEQLTSLIEPLMIAFLGAVVGGMVIALYLPVFSIYELIQ